MCLYTYFFCIVALKLISSFFFFSSRRRHTRFDCDWSSDVCSSDLEAGTDSAIGGISYTKAFPERMSNEERRRQCARPAPDRRFALGRGQPRGEDRGAKNAVRPRSRPQPEPVHVRAERQGARA